MRRANLRIGKISICFDLPISIEVAYVELAFQVSEDFIAIDAISLNQLKNYIVHFDSTLFINIIFDCIFTTFEHLIASGVDRPKFLGGARRQKT